MQVEIKKLVDGAYMPTYATPGSAGADLYSMEEVNIKVGERKLLKTGLSMAIPSGVYGRLAPRSGLAFKSGIDVMAGVIDEDYRGEIGVILINLGEFEKFILPGDKIAQIIFEKYDKADFVDATSLSNTVRGQGGFGSTGT